MPALSAVTAGAVLAASNALGLPIALGATGAIASIWATLMLPWIPSRIGFHFLPPLTRDELDDSNDDAIYERVVQLLGCTLRAESAAGIKPLA